MCSELPEADPCRLTHSGSPALWLPAVHAWEAWEGDWLVVGDGWFGWFLYLQPQLLEHSPWAPVVKPPPFATQAWKQDGLPSVATLWACHLSLSDAPFSANTPLLKHSDSETQKVTFLRVTPDRQGPEHSKIM